MRLLFVILLFPTILTANDEDSSAVRTVISLYPSLQRVTTEAALMPFFYGYSATLDASLLKIDARKKMELGGRFAISKWSGGGGGESSGIHAYAQVVDVLLMVTMKTERTRANVFAGFSHLKYLNNTIDQPLDMFKGGLEVDRLIIAPVAAIMLRLGITRRFPTFSLGISIGYFN
jgi:hypothetical protein